MQNEPAAATFDEIRALIPELPGPDRTAANAVAARERELIKPSGALGRLEKLSAWLATWQGNALPRIRRPRVAIFAANHGIAKRGVSAYPPSVTQQMVEAYINGNAAINQICREIDADLRVYELSLDTPSADFTEAPALTEAECARAVAYGMTTVETGVYLLCLGEMGIGNTTVAAALAAALFGGTGADWVGPGTGVSGDALDRKREAIDSGLARHRDSVADPLEALRRLGGLEFAAIVGAVLAARMAAVPVVLDGFATTAAASVIHRLHPAGLNHCIVAHRSAEPGHARLLTALDKEPLFDLGMRLGEASGAALAVPILRAAVACHTGMATFAEAGVAGREA